MALYPCILIVHICAITLSGGLFFSRGVASLLGAKWPTLRPVRLLSYGIDTVLLAAALTLVFILPKDIFSNQWLSVKLVLVVAYITLGVIAMRSSAAKPIRWCSFILAELVFANILGIALTHNPWGWLSLA